MVTSGCLGDSSTTPKHLQFPLHEKTGNGRQEMRHSLSGGVGTVSRAKGIVHVYFGQTRQVMSKGRIVAFLARIEPKILEHDDLSRLHRLDGCPNVSS